MGWASATGLFDGVVDAVIDLNGVNPKEDHLVREIVRAIYTNVEWSDWDTQDESYYFYEHLVHVMWEQGELDYEYYESFDENANTV